MSTSTQAPRGRVSALTGLSLADPDLAVESVESESTPVSPRQEPATAPQPVAAPSARGTVLLRFVSGLLLAGFVSFLAVFVVGAPLGLIPPSREGAVARTVGAPLVQVSAPSDGLFVALKPLPNGTPIDPGQQLGHMTQTPDVERLAAARAERQFQRERLLRLDDHRDRADGFDLSAAPTLEKEAREVALQILTLTHEIDRLQTLQRKLTICSHVAGRIHFGLGASQAVKAHQPIAFIWPESGELLIEVEAEMRVIHELINANRVEAVFATPAGDEVILALPLPASVKPFTPADERRARKQPWGVLQCTTVTVPEAVRLPGLIGKLR